MVAGGAAVPAEPAAAVRDALRPGPHQGQHHPVPRRGLCSHHPVEPQQVLSSTPHHTTLAHLVGAAGPAVNRNYHSASSVAIDLERRSFGGLQACRIGLMQLIIGSMFGCRAPVCCAAKGFGLKTTYDEHKLPLNFFVF